MPRSDDSYNERGILESGNNKGQSIVFTAGDLLYLIKAVDTRRPLPPVNYFKIIRYGDVFIL